MKHSTGVALTNCDICCSLYIRFVISWIDIIQGYVIAQQHKKL